MKNIRAELEAMQKIINNIVEELNEMENRTKPASPKQKKYLRDLRDKTNADLTDEEIERMTKKEASQRIDQLVKKLPRRKK